MRSLPILLAVAAALAIAIAPPARAAEYTVSSCRGALGVPLSAGAWEPAGAAGTRTDTCAAGGALAVELGSGDTAPGAVAGFRFRVPAGVAITGYTAWIAAETTTAPTSVAQYGAGLGQGAPLSLPDTLDGCDGGVPSCTFGTFADPLAAGNEVERAATGNGLVLLAACGNGTAPCMPDADPPARAALFRSVVRLDDPSSPTVSALGGTVAGPGSESGGRTVVAELSDEGSGVRRVELLADGAVADVQGQPGTCAPPFTVADPCPRSARAMFALDTAALATGPHTLVVRAIDAAGNATDSPPLGIVVTHPAPSPPVIVVPDLPAPPTLRLTAPDRTRLPASGAVTGTARAPDGAPTSGVVLRFEQRPFGAGERAWRRMRPTATTDAAGRFRIPAPAASAQVRTLAPDGSGAAPVVTGFVQPLRATIRSSRKALRNGDRLTLRGRLGNAGGAAGGRTVLIQSRVRGAWRSVDSVETGARGAIGWRYRFTNTRRAARYRFRFVVPATKGLPWKRLATRQVNVLVRP